MMPKRTILLALLALSALAASQEKASADLYPLEVGRYWAYWQAVWREAGLGRVEERTSVRMVLRKTAIRLRTPLGEEGALKEAFVLRTYPTGRRSITRFSTVPGSKSARSGPMPRERRSTPRFTPIQERWRPRGTSVRSSAS